MNILDLIQTDGNTALKRVSSTYGGEYAGACPFVVGRIVLEHGLKVIVSGAEGAEKKATVFNFCETAGVLDILRPAMN